MDGVETLLGCSREELPEPSSMYAIVFQIGLGNPSHERATCILPNSCAGGRCGPGVMAVPVFSFLRWNLGLSNFVEKAENMPARNDYHVNYSI